MWDLDPIGNDPVPFSKDPGMHIKVTQEGLARAGDKFLEVVFIFLRHFSCLSGSATFSSTFKYHCKYFYFAANCLNPGVPYQGKTIDQDFRHGRTVRFTCPRNYVIEGVTAIKCRDGQWNTKKPSCKGKGTLVAFGDLIRKTNKHTHVNKPSTPESL